ncbi:MAG TPA: PAS domain-containing protein [Dongiaceae bacterium]|nr:PAS domain-containing protein [Dongiaceae bacterium]
MATAHFALETQPALQDPGLRVLYDYWLDLSETADGLPLVQSFDPLHLPKLLPNVWIIEVEPASRRFRMRLTGENINAIYGRSIAGLYFKDVFQPDDAEIIVARYSRALSEPAIFHASGSVYAAGGNLTVGERLGLPMLGREGRTNTLLGATVYRSPLEKIAAVRLSHAEPRFHRIRAANHRAPEIAGG